jgi:hypothetical protein
MEFEINDMKRANEQSKNENKYLEELIKEAKKEVRLQQRKQEIIKREYESHALDVNYQMENLEMPMVSPP